MAQRLKAALAVVLVILYPVLSTFLVRHGWSGAVLSLFAALSAWRAFRSGKPAFRFGYALLAVGLLLGALFAETLAARLIPALVHLSLAALFGYTLLHPPSLIERMVRLQFPEFKPGITEYLRQLTWVWTGFFLANVAVCGGLAVFASERVWMMYTGGVVYGLMAVLAVGEYLYRPLRFPDLDIPKPMDSFKVMLRNGHQVFRDLR